MLNTKCFFKTKYLLPDWYTFSLLSTLSIEFFRQLATLNLYIVDGSISGIKQKHLVPSTNRIFFSFQSLYVYKTLYWWISMLVVFPSYQLSSNLSVMTEICKPKGGSGGKQIFSYSKLKSLHCLYYNNPTWSHSYKR